MSNTRSGSSASPLRNACPMNSVIQFRRDSTAGIVGAGHTTLLPLV